MYVCTIVRRAWDSSGRHVYHRRSIDKSCRSSKWRRRSTVASDVCSVSHPRVTSDTTQSLSGVSFSSSTRLVRCRQLIDRCEFSARPPTIYVGSAHWSRSSIGCWRLHRTRLWPQQLGWLGVCYYASDRWDYFRCQWRCTHQHHICIIITDKGDKWVCPCLFVCLSVSKITILKKACMDLDEMLRVNKCRDMDELINFWARSGL